MRAWWAPCRLLAGFASLNLLLLAVLGVAFFCVLEARPPQAPTVTLVPMPSGGSSWPTAAPPAASANGEVPVPEDRREPKPRDFGPPAPQPPAAAPKPAGPAAPVPPGPTVKPGERKLVPEAAAPPENAPGADPVEPVPVPPGPAVPAPAPTPDPSSWTPAPSIFAFSDRNWPRYVHSLLFATSTYGRSMGRNKLSLENPADFHVKVGLRNGNMGYDLVVSAHGSNDVVVPNGAYRVYYKLTTDPDAVFEGKGFVLHNEDAEITLDGHPGLRQEQVVKKDRAPRHPRAGVANGPAPDNGVLPPYTRVLVGRNEVRVVNPNPTRVTAALRHGDFGRDFVIGPNSVASVYVPDGRYDIYFVYADKPDALFQGDSFTLNRNGVQIRLVKVVGGNFGIKQVR